MRGYYSKAISLLLLIGILPLAQAEACCCQNKKTTLLCVSPVKPLPSWFMDIGLGWVFNQKMGSSYLANVGLPSDLYNSPKVNQVPMYFLSGGYLWSRKTEWLPFSSFGLEYSYDMPATVKGVIEEYADPEQANFEYKYKVAHHNLRLIGKADLYRWQNWMPYVSAPVGVSWNRFSDYDQEIISEGESTRPDLDFANKTKLNFSYSLGAGMDYIFTRNIWGGLGYRYDHFGWGKTGDNHNEEFVDKSLKNTSRAHTILLTVRYLFG